MSFPFCNGSYSGTEVVRRAKALAAYNMGPTRFVRILNKMKKDGINIYDSTDWVHELPKYHKDKSNKSIYESRNYIKNILFGGSEEFEEGYIKSLEQKINMDPVNYKNDYLYVFKK